MRLKEIKIVEARLPSWLNKAQGFHIVTDWDQWKSEVIDKGAQEYQTGKKRDGTMFQTYLFPPDAKRNGIGAYEEDGITCHGFWYGDYQLGVVLDQPAIARDEMTGDFIGLPPAFDKLGNFIVDPRAE